MAGFGIPIHAQLQAIIFENGLPKSIESYIYTQYKIYRKDNKDINLNYITTSLINLEQPKETDSHTYTGKFGK